MTFRHEVAANNNKEKLFPDPRCQGLLISKGLNQFFTLTPDFCFFFFGEVPENRLLGKFFCM